MANQNYGAISTMRLPELKELAGRLGIAVQPGMKKADLVKAIRSITGPARRGRPRKYDAAQSSTPRESDGASRAENPRAGRREQGQGVQTPRAAQSSSPRGRAQASKQPRWASSDQPTGGASAASGPEMDQRDAAQRKAQARAAVSEGFGVVPRSTASSMTADEKSAALEAIGEAAERMADAEREDREEGGRNERRNRPNRRHRERRPRSTSAEQREDMELSEPGRSRVEPSEDDGAEASERSDTRHMRQGSRNMRRARQNGQSGQNDRNERRDARNTRVADRGRNRPDRDMRSDMMNANFSEDEDEIAQVEEEVLIPVAGIMDIQGNQAYLRTGGYLPGTHDAHISRQIVKEYGLRRGDAIVGAVKQASAPQNNNHRFSNRHQPHRYNNHQNQMNQLVQIDSINGQSPEQALGRPQFTKLTPLYPEEVLRLETTQKGLTARAIDLLAPIGKGQRGLIVAPPKAGKTVMMQQIAQSIATNNPEVHLMVILVDERPEEVTDMRRLVKGEVIASTFDRPASDHTIVAELAIERAKRLVELGQDVVVLLDSLTRLARAYNLATPPSGRILSGGVDAGALYPPKKFFGAARNIENGGSLTIIASALVETGSKMDEVIFEEFKGTGNMELKLDRSLSDRRIFPAIDVNASGTRREELLFTPDELKIIFQLRHALGSQDIVDASNFVLGRLRKTQNNAEFLMSILRSISGRGTAA